MSGFVDYYKILGVERNATVEEIKQAYRGLAHKYHPDKAENEIGKERFLEITKAYDVLKNESTRRTYNHSYDRRNAGDSGQDYYAILQRARAKRSSRYSRSQYTQRMRYRGSVSTGGSEKPFSYTQKREKRTYNTYSARYAEQVVADYEHSLKVYKRVTYVLRIIVAIVSAFALGVLADKWLASKGDPLSITKIQEIKNRSGFTNGLKVVTAGGTFYCSNQYEFKLLKAKEVRIARTPFRGLITNVYAGEGEKEMKIKLKRSQFGFGFYSLWLLVIGGGLCLVFRGNPELNFKLCMGTLLVGLMVYFSVFYG